MMTPGQRSTYFRLWIAACKEKGWDQKSDALRRAETLECMAKVRGPRLTTSAAGFGPDEVTALFCYLEFLAHPGDVARSARWGDCQIDYRAFNRARQADWHEAKAYGPAGAKKLRRDRFAGAKTAAGGPLEEFNPGEIRKRHLTMAHRHQVKQRAARAATAGLDLVSHIRSASPAANIQEPDPAYTQPSDQPF